MPFNLSLTPPSPMPSTFCQPHTSPHPLPTFNKSLLTNCSSGHLLRARLTDCRVYGFWPRMCFEAVSLGVTAVLGPSSSSGLLHCCHECCTGAKHTELEAFSVHTRLRKQQKACVREHQTAASLLISCALQLTRASLAEEAH
jgi:hypothetical protein